MFKPIVSSVLAAYLLTGCSSVTPAGLIAAARLDPLDANPSDISVAVGVPDQLRLSEGDAALFFSFAPDDAGDTLPISATVPLSISSESGPRAPQDGEAIYIFGLDALGAARLSEVQEQVRALKVEGIPGTGIVRVEVSGGCLVDGALENLRITTWIRTSVDDAFVLLTRQTDLLKGLPPQERLMFESNFKQC